MVGMKRLTRKLLMPLVFGSVIVSTSAFAAENELQKYNLDPVNVTAMSYEKKDIETPADVHVYSGEELMDTGATDVANALKNKSGVMFVHMGPHDQSWITGNSSVNLRGISNGTLVLINGIPASFNQVSHLDNIPLGAIEKVEVVKGGGAVLYGSEAYGGVINIITKDQFQNKVGVGFGNKDQQKYNVSLNIGKASIYLGEDRRGDTENLSQKQGTLTIKGVSKPYYVGFGKSEKHNIGINYKFTDNLKALYMYNRKDYSINYNDGGGYQLKHFDYDDVEQFGQMAYNKGGFDANIYYNNRNIKNPDWFTVDPTKKEWERSNHKNYGLNLKNIWGGSKSTTVVGLTAKRQEYYDENQKWKSSSNSNSALKDYKKIGTHDMNEYALFGQFEYNFNKVFSAALSAREDIIRTDVDNYNQLLPQFQVNAMLNDHNSLYGNVGESFRMPHFRNLYYSSGVITPNPDLQPEHGWNYEAGYKYHQGDAQLKVALFIITLKDMISSRTLADGTSQAYNASRYRNAGIDVEYSNKLFKNLSYNIGGIYNHPEKKDTPTSLWVDTLARYQLAGGLTYKEDKATATLNLSYLGNRAATTGNKDVRPMLISNLHIGYDLAKALGLQYQYLKGLEAKVDVNNLFNRKDVTNSDCTYYTEGRTFMVSLDYSF